EHMWGDSGPCKGLAEFTAQQTSGETPGLVEGLAEFTAQA
ncbi:8444_t:CDS:1, partial [Funneliformis geosporum]